MKTKTLCCQLLLALPVLCLGADHLSLKAVNKLSTARLSQTLELSAQDLAPLGESNFEKIHVRDAAGRELICQAVDVDYDEYHKPDRVIFQADFAAGESKALTVNVGGKQAYRREDFKAYGRFVRERFDDFAWENDLIAHRTYGTALRTWKGEPLTSSAIDIWSKRVSKLVINDWYLMDNYHVDSGEGCDDYSAGTTRGAGGSGIWAGGQLFVPKNFVDSRVLANGPIRILFELVYAPFEANGIMVSNILRISLDAGSQLDHFQTRYRAPGGAPLAIAVGIKKVNGEQVEFSANNGSLVLWEPMEKNLGMQGLAAIVNPRTFDQRAEDRQNHLLVMKAATDGAISYWAGFAWDRAGKITTQKAWKQYVDEFAQGLESPIEVSVSAK